MLEKALLESSRLLQEAISRGLCRRFALIGGLAVSARGFPRATQDIDFLIEVGDADCANLASFLGGTFRPPDLGDPLAGVFAYEASEGVSVQGIRFGPKLTEMSLTDVSHIELEGVVIPVIGVNGLILLKLYAGGAQDLSDVNRLLEVNALSPDSLAQLRATVEVFGLGAKLDAAISTLCRE